MTLNLEVCENFILIYETGIVVFSKAQLKYLSHPVMATSLVETQCQQQEV
jgi:hypothetical protein